MKHPFLYGGGDRLFSPPPLQSFMFLMILLIPISVFSQNILSSKWTKLNQPDVHGNCMAHDSATTSLIIPQVNEDGPIYIFDADDGSYTVDTLNKTKEDFGDLGCFAIGADGKGMIYGHIHDPNRRLVIWNGIDDDNPTTFPLPENLLARNMEVFTSGTATTIYMTGSLDSGPIEVFYAEDGVDFTLKEYFGGIDGNPPGPGGKAGVAADGPYPANRIFGCEIFSSPGVHRWERIDNAMKYIGDVSMPSDIGVVPVVDVALETRNNGILFILICSRTGKPARILALNAATYAEQGRYDIPDSSAVYDRGSLVLDPAKKRLYWYGRAQASTTLSPISSWGCLEYIIPDFEPTPTPTPTPTPFINPDVEIRALWVTRWDYDTTNTMHTILQNAANYHFNMILLQVRGNATTFYPSDLEPWAWELTGSDPSTTGQNPGWDPLAVAINKAHSLDLELHAYMNVYPGWRGTVDPPAESGQLWMTRKDLFCYDKFANIMIPTGWWSTWYSFLSPGHPEARAHIHSVFMEILKNYPKLDGIHYDYCRYPGEVGDWSWNPVDVDLFTTETHATPDEDPTTWAQWKRDQITTLVRENYLEGETLVPGRMYSSAVTGSYTDGYNNNFQASHDWMAEGVLDCLMPMLYTANLSTFTSRLETHLAGRAGRFLSAGIGAASVDDQGLIDEILIARNSGADGVTIFAYSTVFPNHIPNSKAITLINGPFSNIAAIPPMPWKQKHPPSLWILY